MEIVAKEPNMLMTEVYADKSWLLMLASVESLVWRTYQILENTNFYFRCSFFKYTLNLSLFFLED